MNTLPPQLETLFAQAQAAFDKLVSAAPTLEARHAVDAWMQQTLARMGAVPREEFEIQREMLLGLREKVAQLEAVLQQQTHQ